MRTGATAGAQFPVQGPKVLAVPTPGPGAGRARPWKRQGGGSLDSSEAGLDVMGALIWKDPQQPGLRTQFQMSGYGCSVLCLLPSSKSRPSCICGPCLGPLPLVIRALLTVCALHISSLVRE